MKKMNRKAYIFLIDAIFALVILVIGFMIISSKTTTDFSDTPLLLTTNNVVDLLSTLKINEMCTGCVCSYNLISNYCQTDFIKNKDSTVFDYLGELYYRGYSTKAALVFSNITSDFYRKDLFGIELKINSAQIYTDTGKDSTFELISRKKVIFGFYEDPSTGDIKFWGPYILEVNVWPK
ncbi:MAG: hypothetical protein AABW92_02380 [Nanoarchaeota archaeon]